MFPKTGPVRLRTNLGDYPAFRPIKAGTIQSPLVEFDFCGPAVPNMGFKPMIREGRFDAGELAIGSFLQAKIYNKPLVLLPIAIMARFAHPFIEYNSAASGKLTPKDIEGRRVGIRAYTQTTAIWVRGILQHEYDVDLDRTIWVCTDDPHLAEYTDPPNVERIARKSDAIGQMLLDHEIDAVIFNGELSKNEGIEPLIPEPQAAAEKWFAKYGIVPLNHMFVVNAELSKEHPDVVKEIYRLFSENKQQLAKAAGRIDFLPIGFDATRKSLAMIIDYALEQKIIPRRLSVDELFDDTTRALG